MFHAGSIDPAFPLTDPAWHVKIQTKIISNNSSNVIVTFDRVPAGVWQDIKKVDRIVCPPPQ